MSKNRRTYGIWAPLPICAFAFVFQLRIPDTIPRLAAEFLVAAMFLAFFNSAIALHSLQKRIESLEADVRES